MVDAVGNSGYSYDQVIELLSEDGPWTNDTVSYTYANRLRTALSLQLTNSASWSQTYQYDPARRLTGTTSLPGTFGYIYDPTRHLQVGQLVYPHGDYAQNYYDGNARLTSTALENAAGVLDSHAYSNSLGNQRVEQTFLAGNYQDYAYDKIGQLTNAVGKELGGTTDRLQEQLSHAYDAAHNLSNRTENALVQTFGVNNLNELSTAAHSGTLTVAGDTSLPATNVTINGTPAILYRDNAFAKDGFGVTNGNNSFTAIAASPSSQMDTNTVSVNLPATNGYSYDANGNLMSDGLRTFGYDDEIELTSIVVSNSRSSTLTSNIYDGRMRLRIRKEYVWSSGWVPTNEVHYIYDSDVAIQERNSNNAPTITYTRGADKGGRFQEAGGIGGLLARTDNFLTNTSPVAAAHGYYFADGNGNITLLVGYTFYLSRNNSVGKAPPIRN
jgi:YD repeat-containing protein